MRKTIAKSIETAPMVEHSRTVSKPVSLAPNVATIVRATVRIIVIIVLGKNMLHSVKIYDMRAKPLLLGRERDAGRAGRRQRRA
jgi:hypothetical protein